MPIYHHFNKQRIVASNPWSVDITGSISRPADTWSNVESKCLALSQNNSIGKSSGVPLPAGNTDNTMELWFKITGNRFWSGTNSKNILYIGSGTSNIRAIGIDSYAGSLDSFPAKLKIRHGSSSTGTTYTASNPVIMNKWTHVAVAYSASTSSSDVYVDGSYLETITHTATMNMAATGLIAIGSNPNEFEVDEVRIWTVKRTAAQIAASMNTKLVGNETGLIMYYDMQEGIADGYNVGTTTLLDRQTNRAVTNITLPAGFLANTPDATSTRSNWTSRSRALLAAPTVTYSGGNGDGSVLPSAGTYKLRIDTVGTNNKPNFLSAFKDNVLIGYKDVIALGLNGSSITDMFGPGTGTHTFTAGQYEPYTTYTYVSDGSAIVSSSIGNWIYP